MVQEKSSSLFSPSYLLAAGLVAVVAIAFVRGRNDLRTSAPASPAVSKPAPEINLIKLSSAEDIVEVEFELDGKVTLLHLWGTWCGPCRMEYPELARVAKDLEQNQKFQFVPVSCEAGQGETAEGLWMKTSDFFQSEGIDSPVYADHLGFTRGSLVERLDQANLYYPTSVLIGPDGKIQSIWEGYSEAGVDQIKELSLNLLASL